VFLLPLVQWTTSTCRACSASSISRPVGPRLRSLLVANSDNYELIILNECRAACIPHSHKSAARSVLRLPVRRSRFEVYAVRARLLPPVRSVGRDSPWDSCISAST
jgi:hypothetical protein